MDATIIDPSKVYLWQIYLRLSSAAHNLALTLLSNLSPGDAKGQLILKCPFGVFKSSKKPTKFFPGFLP